MSASAASPLPEGYKAPAARLDDKHHGAWIHITSGFGLVVVLISLAIRTYIRTKVSPPFKYDDMTLTAATVLSIVQAGLVFAQVDGGFGTSVELLGNTSLENIQKLGQTADVFYILVMYVGKASVVLLFARITADRFHKAVARALLASCVVLGLVSLLLTALKCDLARPWQVYGQECPTLLAQATAVAVFDMFTELMLFSISILLVYNLHTSVKNKSRVVFAFGTRLPVIAVIVVRLMFLRRLHGSDDPTLEGAITAVLTQLEIFYGLMAATIPCLRPFLAGFITNYGAMGRETIIGGSHVGTGSRKDPVASKGSTFVMSAMTSQERPSRGSILREKFSRPVRRDTIASTQEESFRPDPSGTDTQVRGGYDSRSIASGGSMDSTKMIIKKQMHFHVGSEGEQRHGVAELEDTSSPR